MKSLLDACKPRASVFDAAKRDTVLDLTDLLAPGERINADEFFGENFATDGMKTLLREAFRRFSGDSPHGVFTLTQAMGGGKTHNLIALGLLAKHPELRKAVIGDAYTATGLGKVKVLGFSGRESDAPLGFWGSLADQLGKKELFKDLYTPLQPPGQGAWINLLKGEPKLILIDELPPYLVGAKGRTIGDTNLAVLTVTALANLFVAVGKEELSNVCVVITDLRANYEEGSEQIQKLLKDLQDETTRSALQLSPVQANNDDLYNILRKRLFGSLPSEAEIDEVAQGFAAAVREARQMEITSASPEQFAAAVKQSYPFHPAIRDLYARFKENPGFQQTRGILRLMRVMLSRMYDPDTGWAKGRYLVAPFDLDLNNQETTGQIDLINNSLTNSIPHDIAANGQAVAELMDFNRGGTDASDVCKLLLVSSLSNVSNATLGLTESEVIHYMCAPGRDVGRLRHEVLSQLGSAAWYLHQGRDGRLFFKNTQNVVAKLQTLARACNPELMRRELRKRLEEMFAPALKDCYQHLYVLPAIDEIQVGADRVALVIYEPHAAPQVGADIHPDLRTYYDQLEFKNRVGFLTGSKETLQSLLTVAAESRAIETIIGEMDADKVPDKDPQRQEALKLQDRIQVRLLSAARETFTQLWFPSDTGLRIADFTMEFKDNVYKGEQQVRAALTQKQKFTEEVSGETFKKKVEQRIFTQREMQWAEIKRRAATTPKWQWHRADALEKLKDDLVGKQQWRENGNYVDKGPFPPPCTELRIKDGERNPETGVVTLRLTPVNGDTVYAEIGAKATAASTKIDHTVPYDTTEVKISFLCVDSSGKHATGEAVEWTKPAVLRAGVFEDAGGTRVRLLSAPTATVRYTTDGSEPRHAGGVYTDPFAVERPALVLAVAEKAGVYSPTLRFDVPRDGGTGPKLDPARPVTWKRGHSPKGTKDTYDFLARVKKHQARLVLVQVYLTRENTSDAWAELNLGERLHVTAEVIESAIENVRPVVEGDAISIDVSAGKLLFPTGQLLLDWIAEAKTTLKSGEWEQ